MALLFSLQIFFHFFSNTYNAKRSDKTARGISLVKSIRIALSKAVALKCILWWEPEVHLASQHLLLGLVLLILVYRWVKKVLRRYQNHCGHSVWRTTGKWCGFKNKDIWGHSMAHINNDCSSKQFIRSDFLVLRFSPLCYQQCTLGSLLGSKMNSP